MKDLAKPFIYPSPATLLSRPPESQHASSSNLVSYPHSHTLPHHHHHHHHHLHSHNPGQPGITAAVLNAAASRDERTSSVSALANTGPGSTSMTTAGPPRRESAGLGLGGGFGRGFGSGYGLFGNYRDHDLREHDRPERDAQRERDRERERERERDAKAASLTADTQPSKPATIAGVPSIYQRPPQSPSPNVSRPIPAASLASPSPANNQQLALLQNLAPSTTLTPRPNLPLPQFASLGSRSLPSPFENGRERTKNPAGQAEAPATSHNRTPSNSGSQMESSVPAPVGIGQNSPGKLAILQPTSRNLFSGVASVNRGPSDRDSQRLSTTHTNPAIDPTISPKSSNPAASQQSPYNFPSTFANNPNYNSSFMGFGGGFGYGAFGASWGKERVRGKDKDHERDRQRETDFRPGQEREVERHHLEEKEKMVVEVKPFQPPRQGTAYPDPYRRGYSRIEVLNQPEPSPQYPTTESNVIPQVVPQREPRPYTYSARVESQSQREREYSYTPREKRPRMDAAVEESAHRRGSVSKSKRKREEEKMKSPVPVAPRDFTTLTKEGKPVPEVTSSPVEAWLKTVPDLGRVIANQVYEGSDWTLAKTAWTKGGCEGGVVMVRINGAFIGSGWVIRGQRAWDFAVPTLPTRGELCRGKSDRRVWGTDVYTDDSDLGLVLVHAGWIRWVESAVGDGHDGDVVYVTVRVVPGLVRYTATERNGVKSRSWGNGHDGLSIVVEGVTRASVSLPRSKVNQADDGGADWQERPGFARK